VTVAAVHLGQISEIDWVLKGYAWNRRHGGSGFGLAQHNVAGLAILADDFAVCAHVLSVMATETSVEV